MNVWSLFKELIQPAGAVFGQVSSVNTSTGITTIQIPDISHTAGSVAISDTSASVNDYVIVRNGKIEQKFTIASLLYFDVDI